MYKKDNYLQMRVKENGKWKDRRVHRIVYEEAYGPIPDTLVIHHKNGDKLDNSLDNLELMTMRQHRLFHYNQTKNAKETTHE